MYIYFTENPVRLYICDCIVLFILGSSPGISGKCVARYVGTVAGASGEFTADSDESAICLREDVEVAPA